VEALAGHWVHLEMVAATFSTDSEMRAGIECKVAALISLLDERKAERARQPLERRREESDGAGLFDSEDLALRSRCLSSTDPLRS
jgi:hypothetical protein